MTTLRKDPSAATSDFSSSPIKYATDEQNKIIDRIGGETALTASRVMVTGVDGNMAVSSVASSQLDNLLNAGVNGQVALIASDDVTYTLIGSANIASEMITGYDTVTGVSGDFILISDTGDSGNLKKIDLLDLLGGVGDALVANPLSQFAATTSAQLAGVLSDETGTGLAVFGTSPTLVTPALGIPSALVLTNATGLDVGGILAGSSILEAAIPFVIDGGGSAITTGVKGYVEVPFDCTVKSVRLLADVSGSIVIDVWKDTYANYPPVDADSITASAVPTISTATKSEDTTLTGWTKTLSKGDIIGFNVDSIATIQRVTISLLVDRT